MGTEDDERYRCLDGPELNNVGNMKIAGRISPFKTTVVQGFGMMARTFEVLNRSGSRVA